MRRPDNLKKISHFVLKLLSNVKTKLIEVRFARFFSGGFTAMAVMNPPEKKLENPTSVHCIEIKLLYFCDYKLAQHNLCLL